MPISAGIPASLHVDGPVRPQPPPDDDTDIEQEDAERRGALDHGVHRYPIAREARSAALRARRSDFRQRLALDLAG
jgi:hypothetical protein